MAKREKQPPQGDAPRRRHTAAIGNDAQTLGRAGFERAGFLEPGLVLHWKDVVGPDVARIAHPLRLSTGGVGGVLTLRADPAASVFLQHESRAICGRINAFLGRDAVHRLRFVAGDIAPEVKPKPRAHPATEPGSDDPARQFSGSDSLKSALLALARARRGSH